MSVYRPSLPIDYFDGLTPLNEWNRRRPRSPAHGMGAARVGVPANVPSHVRTNVPMPVGVRCQAERTVCGMSGHGTFLH